MSRNKNRVLVTDPLHPEVEQLLATWADIERLPPLQDPLESDRLVLERAPHVDGIVVRRLLPTDIFDRPNHLRGVVRQGTGVDFIPVDRATVWGIPVGNTPGINANAVAEYVFAAMLWHGRRLAQFDALVRDGQWQARQHAGAHTFELGEKKLGIIGYGAVGRRIASIGRHGFGMTIQVHTSNPSVVPAGIHTMPLAKLFETSDFIVIACPLTPQTRGMVDARILARAKPNAVLINVGRGPVVRQEDLEHALANRLLGGASLDVYEVHPLPQDSPLRSHPGVSLTPHLAGITRESERAMGVMAIDTLQAILAGRQPQNIVNPEVFKRKEYRELFRKEGSAIFYL